MPLITNLVSAAFVSIYCIILIFFYIKTLDKIFIIFLLSIIMSGLLIKFLKLIFIRERPFKKYTNLNVTKIGIDNFSFPSGHASISFAITMNIYFFCPYIFPICLILAILVSYSRMYIGVHYPSDVLIGMLVGLLTSYAVYLFFLHSNLFKYSYLYNHIFIC